jgi:hypothetical protein
MPTEKLYLMNPTIRVLCLPFLLLGFGQGAYGREPESRFELFGQAGVSVFSDKSRFVEIPFFDLPTGTIQSFPATRTTFLKTSARVFTGARFYITEKDALEASYSYAPSDFTERDMVFGPLGTSVFDTVIDVHANFVAFNYVRYLRTEAGWRPFATGGVGFVHFGGLPNATKFSGNLGGGVDFMLSRRLALRTEYRVFLTPRPGLPERNVLGGPGPVRGVLQNHVPSAGLVLRF